MSTCNLDHSFEDVRKKYESQSEFLPEDINERFPEFFEKQHSQEVLNECFHFLKKYDLATDEEKEVRNIKLIQLLVNN